MIPYGYTLTEHEEDVRTCLIEEEIERLMELGMDEQSATVEAILSVDRAAWRDE